MHFNQYAIRCGAPLVIVAVGLFVPAVLRLLSGAVVAVDVRAAKGAKGAVHEDPDIPNYL